ncbi:hypothetical protein [Numidum massiliense]|uniref:hypothetical protein n=1 Tax=Numidum massiliense TaxID=1522315 RepID=UPI0006D5587A|nr:hypothetical protein [Numidum massiliense]
MKLPQFSDTSKSFRLVLGIVAFIVAIMLAIGFGIVAVKLIINDVPYSTAILIVSQIILWLFVYRGADWLYKSIVSSKEEQVTQQEQSIQKERTTSPTCSDKADRTS